MPNRARYSAETALYAASRGIEADELPLIVDGCSGGLSRLYAIGGRTVSCQECCNRHDIDYQLGGSREERRESDLRLRRCSAGAGLYPAGPLGLARRLWRNCRAWLMWAAVRCAGWLWWGG